MKSGRLKLRKKKGQVDEKKERKALTKQMKQMQKDLEERHAAEIAAFCGLQFKEEARKPGSRLQRPKKTTPAPAHPAPPHRARTLSALAAAPLLRVTHARRATAQVRAHGVEAGRDGRSELRD